MDEFSYQLPESWPKNIKETLLHIASMAFASITQTDAWGENSPISRVRAETKAARFESKLAVSEEIRQLNGARLERTSARKLAHYTPQERMRILELRALRGWSIRQTSERFHVDPDTIRSWLSRVDDDDGLLRTPKPINKFSDACRHVVCLLKATCPRFGKKRIAQELTDAGVQISTSTVGRILKKPPKPTHQPSPDVTPTSGAQRRVAARYPHHVWHVDLTVVTTQSGIACSWWPHSFPTVWPFCWIVAVVIDQFTRQILAVQAFHKEPTAEEVAATLDDASSHAGSTPKHIISDKGSQFWKSKAYGAWCEKVKASPRFGAIGQCGSIAMVERLIRTLKDQCTRRILVSFNRQAFQTELNYFMIWHNHYRSHQGIGGRKPASMASHPQLKVAGPPVQQHADPAGRLDIQYYMGRKHLPVIKLVRADQYSPPLLRAA